MFTEGLFVGIVIDSVLGVCLGIIIISLLVSGRCKGSDEKAESLIMEYSELARYSDALVKKVEAVISSSDNNFSIEELLSLKCALEEYSKRFTSASILDATRFTESQLKICSDVANVQPPYWVSIVTMEECAELIQAVSKFNRSECYSPTILENLSEEIADVLICIHLLEFQISEISSELEIKLDEKVQRLQHRYIFNLHNLKF